MDSYIQKTWPLYVVILLLVVSNVFTLKFYFTQRSRVVDLEQSLAEQSQSLGVLAGQAVLDLRKKTEESYLVAQKQATDVIRELEQKGAEALSAMNRSMETSRLEMERTAQLLLKRFQEEVDKFNATVESSDPNAMQPAGSGTGTQKPSTNP